MFWNLFKRRKTDNERWGEAFMRRAENVSPPVEPAVADAPPVATKRDDDSANMVCGLVTQTCLLNVSIASIHPGV